MKEQLVFVKDYKDQKDLRKSFNELAATTFGIEFETWFRHGFWTEKYQPYSFVVDGKVVANVSVNLLKLVIDNELKQAVQIGTVMTDPNFRNQGLSRMLMEKVLEDFKDADLFYLFANQSVLEFYPKFGFIQTKQIQLSMDYHHIVTKAQQIRKLNVKKREDLDFIYKLAISRVSVSDIFDTANSAELLMFYCIMVFAEDLYYIEDLNTFVIYQMEDDILHLYDLVSSQQVKVYEAISKIANDNVKKVVFHFHVDIPEVELTKETYQDSNVLFVKNLNGVKLPKDFKHPITAQA